MTAEYWNGFKWLRQPNKGFNLEESCNELIIDQKNQIHIAKGIKNNL